MPDGYEDFGAIGGTDGLDAAEEKWYRKARAGFQRRWATMVANSNSYNQLTGKIAALLNVDPSSVQGSLPAYSYRVFQQRVRSNPSYYVNKALRNIAVAHRNKAWSKKYRAAWTSGGEVSPGGEEPLM